MKTKYSKVVIALVTAMFLSAFVNAQNIFPTGAGTDAGINTTTPRNTDLEIVTDGTHTITNQNWNIAQRIRPSNQEGAGIFWDNGSIQNCDPPNDTSETFFFIGGPSCRPIGSYWMGFAYENNLTGAPTYAAEIVGKTDANPKRAIGAFSFKQNVFMDSSLAIGVAQMTEQLHTSAGVRFAGLPASTTDQRIITSDNNGVLHFQAMTVPAPGGSWLSSGCATNNFVLKQGANSTALCSQIYDNATNVGIGTGTSPTTKLHVNGQSLWLTGGDGGSSGWLSPAAGSGLRSYYDATNNYAVIFTHHYGSPSATRNLLIQTPGTGYLAVGTTTPTAKFHVNLSSHTATTGLRFEGLASSSNSDFLVMDGSGNVTKRTISPFPSGSYTCSTANNIPRNTGTNTLGCGIMTDNTVGVGVSMTAGTWTGGGVDITGSPTNPTDVKLDVNGMVRCSTLVVISDRRLKEQIGQIDNSLEIIKKLNGVQYFFKPEVTKLGTTPANKQYGFIAQDIEKVMPEIVGKDSEGGLSVNYLQVIPVLAEAIKELDGKATLNENLHDDVRDQKSEIDLLKAQVSELQNMLKEVCNNGCEGLNRGNIITPSKDAILYPAIPNPASSTTVLGYSINVPFTHAMIVVIDLKGNVLKEYGIQGQGVGSVQFERNNLNDGAYKYSLIIDGKVIDSKSIVLAGN